jgi:DUF218 domain
VKSCDVDPLMSERMRTRRKPFLGLARRREVLVPTWRGWLFLICVALLAFSAFLFGILPFLAVTDPVRGGILVVEGWGSEAAMRTVVEEFRAHPYERLYVTGGPIEESSPLASYKTVAELGAATLERMGLTPSEVQAVPAPKVKQDRTYASAVALRRWLKEHGLTVDKVNVVSMGAHSRRTRFLFQKAFGDQARVGIIASADPEFDSRYWWTTSQGFRGVTAEIIAYAYVRLLFRVPPE